MSGNLDDILGKGAGADDDAGDPAIDGMKKIAKHVVKRDERVEKRLTESDSKLEKGLKHLDEKIERGLGLVADKLEAFGKRTSALNILGATDPGSDLISTLSDEDRALIPIYEMHIANGDVNSLSDRMKDPRFRCAMGTFMISAFKSHPALEGPGILAKCAKIHEAFEDAYGGIATKAAFDTTDTDVGGNTVPTAIENELRRLITDNSILRPDVTKIPMMTKTVELPKEGTNALTVTVGGTEGGTIPDSIPATAVTAIVSMVAAMYKGRAVASVESLQDSAISIMEWIQAKLTEEMGRAEDTQGIEGTGSPHTGLLGDSDVNEIVAGTNGDPVTYPLLAAMVFNAGERATRRGAKWYFSPALMGDIIGLVDSNGQPIVKYGTVPDSISPTLLGFQVEVHSGILANRTKGTGTGLSHAYFGNPKAIVFGDRTGMTWSVSDAPGFDNDQIHMKLTKRTGIVVGVPLAFTRRLDFDTTAS